MSMSFLTCACNDVVVSGLIVGFGNVVVVVVSVDTAGG